MKRPSLPFSCALTLLPLVAGCSAQMGGSDRRYEDLRGLVLEHRRAIEDLRREQESLRAAIDQMQYGNRPRGISKPIYGPAGPGAGAPPVNEESYWGRPLVPAATGDAAAPGAPGAAVAGTDVAALGGAPVAPAPPPPPPAPIANPASEPAKASTPPELSGTAYDSAMRSLQSGDQDEAIQSFRNYLHDNGASPYADDAQFWIGEAYFRKGQYHRAIIEFNSVSTNYGSGDRAPSALLRQAEAFRIVGDRVDARLSLQKVINRYPGTSEASKASKMLSEIGG